VRVYHFLGLVFDSKGGLSEESVKELPNGPLPGSVGPINSITG
jgi:hypothetical protein